MSSLVYFLTSLPRLDDEAVEDLPLTTAAFVTRARETLEGTAREQLELLLLLDEIDESSRVVSRVTARTPNASPGVLATALRTERQRPANAPPLADLPEWILAPLPRHLQLRRCYRLFYDEGGAVLA